MNVLDGNDLGCQSINDDEYVDNIVIIDRGICEFTVKVIAIC